MTKLNKEDKMTVAIEPMEEDADLVVFRISIDDILRLAVLIAKIILSVNAPMVASPFTDKSSDILISVGPAYPVPQKESVTH